MAFAPTWVAIAPMGDDLWIGMPHVNGRFANLDGALDKWRSPLQDVRLDGDCH
ncbi:MAG: hypothetical protein ACFE0I_01450 [Elainellaceae cyanobacterium]